MPQDKCRVLCIDDHADSAEMLRILLSHEDYEVTIATSIQEALHFARSEAFDLYVVHKHLPDGTGLELCRRLNEVTPNIPCIFYTGDAYETHRQEAIAAGADGYVCKPDIERLVNVVHKLLADRECETAQAQGA